LSSLHWPMSTGSCFPGTLLCATRSYVVIFLPINWSG
jgi:hypothetical protein